LGSGRELLDLEALIQASDLTWHEVLIRIVAAVAVGAVIGTEREYKNRPAGMRTHTLVCLGSAIAAILEGLLTKTLLAGAVGEQVSISMGRLSAQVISGIGFLGAGTIFVAQKKISGLTTAASLWNVACLGLMIGFGFYWLALIACGLIMLVLTALQRIIRVRPYKRVEIRFTNRSIALPFINEYMQRNHIKVLDIDFHIEHQPQVGRPDENIYTNIYTLHMPSDLHFSDMVTDLSENPDIQTVRTRNV
jgi:putative Mg2+ transporter-C (MgtC) family protein